MKNYYIFLGLAITLLGSCEITKPTTTENSLDMELTDSKDIIINENEPLIAFFNFRLWATADGTVQIQKISTSVANGNLKNDYKKHVNVEEGYILCSFLDESETVIKQTLISNFLEPSPENLQQGQKEATFFLKTQWSKTISTIQFDLIGENSDRKLLKTIKL